MVSQTEKVIKDAGNKIDDKVKKSVQEKVEALKKVKDGDDLAEIKKAAEELSGEIQKIGAQMYQSASASNASAGQSSQGKDEPIEGKVKNDKKK